MYKMGLNRVDVGENTIKIIATITRGSSMQSLASLVTSSTEHLIDSLMAHKCM